ncbi:MAG: phosphoribosylformylglycinamidine synthase subunit PurL [bacterium]|nr:phosphoribosylformylglycinamidine synthase subunit PurL [bacterium]
MIYRIEVGFKPQLKDALGEKTRQRIYRDLNILIDSVRIVNIYTVESNLSLEQINLLSQGPYCDHIIQNYTINKPLYTDFDWLIEVGFRPGVTDNVGKTAKEAIESFFNTNLTRNENVYTSTQYLLKGELSEFQVDTIAHDLLANTLIQKYTIMSRNDFNPFVGLKAYIPKVIEKAKATVSEINLDVSDEELIRISKDGILALTLEEMKAIKDYIGSKHVKEQRLSVGISQNITDVELEALAQTWSEHCKHKIFNAIIEYIDDKGNTCTIDSLFNTYIKGSTKVIRESKGKDDFCLSVFKDNAGVIKFNHDYNLVFKIETHNTPSALDPYGGAITGIVGVNRDPFGTGLGAKLIFNTDVFCFASPFYNKPLPPRIFHPKRIFEGVREGVEHGGNKSGIPTINGCIVFDDRYLGKPLVYCGTGGIMPRKIGSKDSHLKIAYTGDLIVMTGGRIGKDGIHGATFSSQELHEDSPVSAVQIGDPITQKKMTDFLLEARNLGLYNSITDNGAGGLSSSIGEMAQDSGGCELYIEKAPLKYSGLNPWEILVSESQERMTLAVPPSKIEQFLDLAKKMKVEATVIGKFTNSGKFHVFYQGKTVAYLDMDFFHNGLPKMKITAKWQPKIQPEPDFPQPLDLNQTLKIMLSRLNICSKEYVVRQYDHEVQGTSVIKPLVGKFNDGPSDAAVIRPLLNSMEGVVVSNGICPRYSDIDAYHMMANAIDEAIRNAISVGGSLDYLAGLDNFCWCDPVKSEKNPDGEYKLAQLVRANMALYDYTTIYGVPCISGKDSMKNDYQIGNIKISVPPTILYSCIGKIENVRKCVTMDVKNPGDLIYILGITFEELGGSEYFALHNFIGNKVPNVDAKKAKVLYQSLAKAINLGLVVSCHDCSDGGLGVALAEIAFAGGYGLDIDLKTVPIKDINRDDYLLFSESASRFLVTIKPQDKIMFEELLKLNTFAEIGIVTESQHLKITGLKGTILINENIQELKDSWQKPLKW